MANHLGWARVRPSSNGSLRRGAWYQVVSDDGSAVVIKVGERGVSVPREHLQIRRHCPEHFSVVVRSPGDHNPVRGTPEDLGLKYAVCPSSHTRVRLADDAPYLVCPECGCRYAIDWGETC